MLAYVFWHWRQSSVTRETYEAHLASFHQTLADNGPPGFRHSVVFAIENAFWLGTSGVAYEEWYVVDDSAALDPLNIAAVSGACEAPHNLVARQAADGIGGLYRWRDGIQRVSGAKYATWLAKPEGVSYKDFYATLQPLLSQHESALWGRQMTLGPTKEFCVQSPHPIELPAGYQGEQLTLTQVWPVS
jgi:hypothetical protein